MVTKTPSARHVSKSKKAKPFLKWAGGKSQLISQFDEYFPDELKQGKIDNYIEPFVGGGAVFFHVAQRYEISKAYLYDINQELIIALKTVQREPHELIEELHELSSRYDNLKEDEKRDFYYHTRERFNENRLNIDYENFSTEWVERTAQLIFLNRTCFNGLFRLNSKGEFNVPHGKYKNPRIVNEENILTVHKLSKLAEIKTGDFAECEAVITPSSFIYFDPPYRPISQTASFTSYSKYSFDDQSQIRLANFFRHLDEKYNVKMMLSNSDPTNENHDDRFFESLFEGFNIYKVRASRMINCNAERRGQINEILVTNY
ncbi:MAG: DNA adenine methylase [Dehalococcoidia bacterium]